MTTKATSMDKWQDLPWRKLECNVFKLQKRIYQASQRGDRKTVHNLQRLLLKSRAAKLLAVRRVTQDNQGKKTAGVDGIKSLTPQQRIGLTNNLVIGSKASPLRRIWIPKPGTDEKRGLSIPTIKDRAGQSLVKMALEPEWEAKFEARSFGFRPGRSCHDAIETIFCIIHKKAKWTLDADIAKCFDRISQTALMKKLDTSPMIQRQIKVWLKSGVLDGQDWSATEDGVPQGGTISPLLMNVALHGLETTIAKQFYKKDVSLMIVKYADDLVALHQDRTVIEQCQQAISEWLAEMGLALKPSKTRIVHTMEKSDSGAGFDFLGFNIRQYRVGKNRSGKNAHNQLLGFKTIITPSKTAIKRHTQKLKQILTRHRSSTQQELIKALNPIIKGWSNYYSTVVSKKIFSKLGTILFQMLFAWARRRHPHKSKRWVVDKYWRIGNRGWQFQPRNSDLRLYQHRETPIRRHVKVVGTRSPYDGDWVYWSKRLGRNPEIPLRIAMLLKRQEGICLECNLFFTTADIMEVDHIIPKELGGIDVYNNLQLLHRHCHDVKTAREQAGKKCA